jgi:hypothetical protein
MLHIDHAALGGAVALNVALRCRERGMPSQLLDVTQAAASFDDLLCYSGDERAPPGMRASAAAPFADGQCPLGKIYNERGPNRASIIRLASATISSVLLFSRLEGLSANARVDPGAKIAALQPLPTWLTSIRYPLYSMTVINCACPRPLTKLRRSRSRTRR